MENLSRFFLNSKPANLKQILTQKWRRTRVEFFIQFKDFVICEKFFDLCGFSLLNQAEAREVKIKKPLILGLVCIFLYIVESLISLGVYLRDWKNFYASAENIVVVCMLTLILLKGYWVLIHNRKTILEVIEKLDEHFPHHGFHQHIYGTRKYLKELKIISGIVAFVYFGCITHFMTFTFQCQFYYWLTSQSHEWDLISPHWFPFDIRNPLGFLVTFLWYGYALVISAILMFSCDILYAGLLMITSMEFDILAADIEETRDENELIKLIKVHQELIEVTGKLEEIFSPLLFVNIFLLLSSMCFTAFLAFLDLSVLLIMKYFGSFFVEVTNSFLLCYFAQKLKDSSSSIAFAAYSTPWYELSLKFRKLIVIVMIIAKNGQALTAWSFFDVSMQIFYWMLDTTYSYYSALLGLYEMKL